MIIQHAELPEVTNELSVSLRLNILHRNSVWACIFHKGELNKVRTPTLWLTPKNSAPHAQFSTTDCISAGIDSVGSGLSLNRWYHLVYTLSEPEKQLDFYIDGKCPNIPTGDNPGGPNNSGGGVNPEGWVGLWLIREVRMILVVHVIVVNTNPD
ncbi:8312_t:CDS:2, partial [Ambispora leptoticha]